MKEAAEQTTEQMEKVTQGMMQACDELNMHYCDFTDAAVKASSALARGAEEFNRRWGGLLQESMARAMSTSKNIMSAKSVKEISELQAEFVKDYVDQWMAATGRLSEISAKTTQEAFEPVARHASDAMSRVAQKAQVSGRSAAA